MLMLMLTVEKPKEPLVMYLAASDKEISIVLIVDSGNIQTPIYYTSCTLTDAERTQVTRKHRAV